MTCRVARAHWMPTPQAPVENLLCSQHWELWGTPPPGMGA